MQKATPASAIMAVVRFWIRLSNWPLTVHVNFVGPALPMFSPTQARSQANQAVFLAFLNPGDTFLGMSLNAGGHLTHGSKVNLSGKWFNPVSYGVDPQTHLIDYDEVRDVAQKDKPKLIIAGGSAYPRTIDFAKFREIADEVGALLMVGRYGALFWPCGRRCSSISSPLSGRGHEYNPQNLARSQERYHPHNKP